MLRIVLTATTWGFAVLAALVQAAAQTLYVDNLAGQDYYDGRVPQVQSEYSGPVRTLARALELARPSETIVIENTGLPYYESVTLFGPTNSGVPQAPFVIEGNGAVFRGARPVPPPAWQAVGIDLYRVTPFRKGHYQVVVNGSAGLEVPVAFGSQEVPALEPLQWAAAGGQIYFRTEPAQFIDSYAIEFAQLDVGLTLYDVHDVVIRDLTLEHYRLDGIHAARRVGDRERPQSVVLENIVCRENGRCGLANSETCALLLGAVELSGNREAQLLARETSVTALVECMLGDFPGPALVTEGEPTVIRDAPLEPVE